MRYNIDKNSYAMHTIKLLLTYYLNISVQAANLSDCRIETKKIDSAARIDSNRIETFFLPELECSSLYQRAPHQKKLFLETCL